MQEKRISKRIPHHELPLFFKSFSLEVGRYKNIEAQTIDASTNGIAFIVPDNINNIKIWEAVTMNSKDGRFKFFGNVVYLSNDFSNLQQKRLGVKFV